MRRSFQSTGARDTDRKYFMSKKFELSIHLRGRGWKYLAVVLLLLATAFLPLDGNKLPAVTTEGGGSCIATDVE